LLWSRHATGARRLRLEATREQACVVEPFILLFGLSDTVILQVGKRYQLSLTTANSREGQEEEGGVMSGWWALIGVVTMSPLWKRVWGSRSCSLEQLSLRRLQLEARVANAVLVAAVSGALAVCISVLLPVLTTVFLLFSAILTGAVLLSPTVHTAAADTMSTLFLALLSVSTFRELPPYAGSRHKRKRQAVCLLALLYVGFWVAIPYTHYHGPLWPYIKWAGSVFRLEQYWTMFAPEPPTTQGWWLAVALLENGEVQDLWKDQCGQVPHGDASTGFWRWLWVGGGGRDVLDLALGTGSHCGHAAERDGDEVRHERDAQPLLLSASFKNQRWRKFFMNMRQERFSPWAGEEYVGFLCRQWNAVAGLPRAAAVRLEYVQQAIAAPGEEAPEPIEYLVAYAECARWQ